MSIALSIKSSALGDTLAAIPTLKKLSQAHGRALTVFSHHPYLFKDHPCVKNTFHINSSQEKYKTYVTPFSTKDQVNGKTVEFKHAQIDIRQFHALSLGFSLTPEEMEMDLYIEENWNVGFENYVVIHPTHTWPSRTWNTHKWQKLIYKLNELNIPVVAIGKDSSENGFYDINKPVMDLDIPYGINLLNHPESSIAKIRGLLKKARCLIAMDSGILHIAGTTDVEIIQLGSSIHPYYRAPYRKGSQSYKYTHVGGTCSLFCTSNMKHHLKEWNDIQGVPPLIGCLENKPTFECHPTPEKVLDIVLNKKSITLPKLLIVTPHLSTGGSPQYILDYLKYNKSEYSEIKLVEFTEFSWEYTIQKNKLIKLLGKENVYTLGAYGSSTFNQDKEKLLPLLEDYLPDIIWMNEVPEAYEYKLPPDSVMDVLYSPKREYKIIETTHFNALDFKAKKFIPDEFMFCSPNHIKESEHLDIPKKVWQSPIENKSRPNRNSTLIELGLDPSKYHVLNVGLVCPNKNQKYIFDLAEKTLNLPVQYHFIGNHCFFDQTGITDHQKSLSNCVLWGERDDVDKFMSCMDLYLFPSQKELNPLTIKEALSWGMDIIANHDPSYTDQYKDISNFNIMQETNPIKFINSKLPLPEYTPNEINVSYQQGAKVEIIGDIPYEYQVEFYDNDTNTLIHSGTIKNNMWIAPNRTYYTNWKVIVKSNNKNIYEDTFNLKGKRVIIYLDSKSLGDTIAWFPYIEEFRKKHNCHVICSTFHNKWFESQYPKLEFTPMGTSSSDIYAIYGIGWFKGKDNKFNPDKNPNDFKAQPLQKTASDILGLEYKEIKPKLKKFSKSPITEKYVTISIQSTSQCKYWNHPTGWKQLVKYFQDKGLKVAIVDQHRTFGIKGFMNTSPQADYHFHNKSLEEAISVIQGAELHVSISSGLSWIAWASEIPVVLISSFTHPDQCEFKSNCTRIYSDSPLSGYFGTHNFNAGDWNWYPFKKIKSMEDWYEAETITPDLVIKNLDRIL
tara:strand:+ start:1528 stop:4554 length:3027 start_codon:yes stop_codon:yes gene_type:complete